MELEHWYNLLLIHNINGNKSIHELFISRDLRFTAREGHHGGNGFHALALLNLAFSIPLPPALQLRVFTT